MLNNGVQPSLQHDFCRSNCILFYNSCTGDMYWKFDELRSKRDCDVLPGYPRSVRRVWRGVSLPIDAAFTSFDGEKSLYTYHTHIKLL